MREEWTSWRKANYAFLKTHLGLVSGVAVDMGCGDIQAASAFTDLYKGLMYIGVDFKKFNEGTVVADLMKPIPLGTGFADVVTLNNTLEHLPDPRPVLSEAARILKPGGKLVGTVPFLQGEHQLPYDFNRYTHVQLEQLLSEAGLTHISIIALGEQMDVYNSIELKVFDELRKTHGGVVLEIVRTWRRLEMRLLRWLLKGKSCFKVTEGYGFIGYAATRDVSE